VTAEQCSVEDCQGPARWHGMCPKHATRMRRHGNPHAFVEIPDRNHRRGPDSGRWVGDDASYSAVHRRMRIAKGLASSYPCVDCGAPAANWSYDYKAADERVCSTGQPFSADPAHYHPRCLPCHRRFDANFLPSPGRPIDREAVVRLHAEGVGANRIAAQMHVAVYRVTRLLDELGLPRLPAGGKPGVKWEKCRHGHEYTPDNTLIDDPEGRRCRICKEASEKRHTRRRAERRRAAQVVADSSEGATA
jgi:hypothetical protein